MGPRHWAAICVGLAAVPRPGGLADLVGMFVGLGGLVCWRGRVDGPAWLAGLNWLAWLFLGLAWLALLS